MTTSAEAAAEVSGGLQFSPSFTKWNSFLSVVVFCRSSSSSAVVDALSLWFFARDVIVSFKILHGVHSVLCSYACVCFCMVHLFILVDAIIDGS